MAKENGKANQAGKETSQSTKLVPRTRAIADRGIRTEENLDLAVSGIFSDLADGRADYEQTRLMLSAIGKKLNLENLKVRAGVYKQPGVKSFFLTA